MNILFIGTGAAGNKAAINLLEKGIINENDLMLINSTLTDIPEQYRKYGVKLSDIEGCGKERTTAKSIAVGSIIQEKLQLRERIIENGYKKVVIITSIEGGTGSGSAVILADFICMDVKPVFVEIYAFKGFEKDTRGLANSIEFFKEVPQECGLHIICNDRFLKEAMGNELNAQKLANDELAKKIKVSLGQLLNQDENYDCSNNIDQTDLYKLTNTSGYSVTEYVPIDDKIKSVEEYNRLVSEMINSTKSFEVEKPSARCIGVIANIEKNSRDNIDYTHKVIREHFGDAYDTFDQFYSNPDKEQFIAIMASGLKMPSKAIDELKEKYEKRSSQIDKSADDFYANRKSLMGNSEDLRFDMVKLKNNEPVATEGISSAFLDKYKAKPKKTIKSNKTLIEPVNESDY